MSRLAVVIIVATMAARVGQFGLAAPSDANSAGEKSPWEPTDHYQRQQIEGWTVLVNALNNDKEYFAEATEAFFGTNDFYPFVRSELLAHDPKMHELL